MFTALEEQLALKLATRRLTDGAPPLPAALTPPAHRWLRWTTVGAIVVLFVMLPFVVFERGINDWTVHQLHTSTEPAWTAGIVVALLAADVVLPIPSSLVSTAAGARLGFLLGVAASACGMTVGVLIGYLLGRTLGLPVARRLVSTQDLEIVSDRLRRRAVGALVMMRAVPVLAEGSVLMAGVLRINPWRFFASTFLANVGISVAYCSVGALALSMNSFALAFAGAIAVPAVMLHVLRRPPRDRSI